MLKRSCPRFMTCVVTAKGKPSPSALLILPVTRKPSSGSSPRATVPGTRGRADMPSAKKSLGSSGSYLGWLAIFWRHASAKMSSRRNAGLRLPRDISDLPRMQRFQKGPGLVQVELRIALLHDEEE